MSEEKRSRITGFNWDPGWGEGVYTIEGPGAETYRLAVRTEGKNRVVLMLWQGDLHDENNHLVADSDPLRLGYEDERESFYQTVTEVFGEMPWFREVLAYINRTHDKKVEEAMDERFREEVEAAPDYRAIPGTDYFATPDGFAIEEARYGGRDLVFLSNFTARILEDIEEDDGSGETNRLFKIEARLRDRTKTFEVQADRFASLGWVPQRLGALAVIQPPTGSNKPRVAHAIQADSSTDLVEVRGFAHTGWAEVGGRWVYLHGGGAIAGFSAAPFEGRVILRGRLARRVLPEPVEDDDLRAAVRATFKIWDLAAYEVAIPIDLAAKRAVLGRVDFSVHLAGPTGRGKTALSLIALNYFGRGLKEEDSISFESTANAIEAEAFALKDQLHLLDDYLGTPDHRDTLGRIARAAANNSGRARMGRNGTPKGDKPPRALVLSTGEDVPVGESLSARILVLRVPEDGGVDFSPGALINSLQDDAKNGVYARAMAGFVAWLAPRYADVDAGLENERARLARQVWREGQHNRTPRIYGDLVLGLRYWLDYAHDIGAIDRAEYEARLAHGEGAIAAASAEQAGFQRANDPVEGLRDLLVRAVSSGKAHFTDPEHPSGLPENPERWGWRVRSDGSHEPQGDKIGWVRRDGLYLYPEAALDLVKELGISQQALSGRLYDRGWLASTDHEKARGTATVRRTVRGESATFLHIKRSYLGEKR